VSIDGKGANAGTRAGEVAMSANLDHLEPIEVSEALDKTVVRVHFHGRIKGSGDIVDMHEVWVLSWRGDRIIEIREYKNKAEAVKAVEP